MMNIELRGRGRLAALTVMLALTLGGCPGSGGGGVTGDDAPVDKTPPPGSTVDPGKAAVVTSTAGGSCDGVSVLDFGALGDGVNDDLPAFEQALAAAAGNPAAGRQVCVPSPPVAYLLGRTLEIDVPGIRIVGRYLPRIVASEGELIDLIRVTANDVAIENLTLIGNGGFDVGIAIRPSLIRVRDANGTLIANNRMIDPPSHGVFLHGVSGAVVRDNWVRGGPPQCSEPQQQQCHDSPSGRFAVGHQAIRLIGVYKSRVENNLIMPGDAGPADSAPVIGIFVGADVRHPTLDGDLQASATDLKIHANDVTHAHDKGIYIGTCIGCSVTGNTVKYSGFSGIVVGSSINFEQDEADNLSGNTVTGNHVYNAVSQQSYGIHMRDAVGAIVSDNHVYDCGNGILVSSVSFDGVLSDNYIGGNTIRGYSGNGIVFSKGARSVSAMRHNRVVNNLISTRSERQGRDWLAVGAAIVLARIGSQNPVAPRHSVISGNVIIEPPRHGIEVSGQRHGTVVGNHIVRPGSAPGGNGNVRARAISAGGADAVSVRDNLCEPADAAGCEMIP